MKYLVMEGDWGGQIFMTVPMSLVGSNAKPHKLLKYFNRAAWRCDWKHEGISCAIYIGDIGDGVAGGMGGGELTAEIWLHPEFAGESWQKLVRQLLGMLENR